MGVFGPFAFLEMHTIPYIKRGKSDPVYTHARGGGNGYLLVVLIRPLIRVDPPETQRGHPMDGVDLGYKGVSLERGQLTPIWLRTIRWPFWPPSLEP